MSNKAVKMKDKYKSIQEMKNVLLQAVQKENYNPPAELEQDFCKLIEEALLTTDLAPYINDINYILISLMALADVLDLKNKGVI